MTLKQWPWELCVSLLHVECEPGLWTNEDKLGQRNSFLGFVFLFYLLLGGLFSSLSELPF